eukprot:26630_4
MPHSGELHTVHSWRRPLDFLRPCMVCMSRLVLYAPSLITRSTCIISTSSTTILNLSFSASSFSPSPPSSCSSAFLSC